MPSIYDVSSHSGNCHERHLKNFLKNLKILYFRRIYHVG